MKKSYGLLSIALFGLMIIATSCGSSRSTTSRYPYPGSTYPYPGSTYPYPESYPYPRTYPTARYPRQSPPVVVYREPRKVYVPVERRRNERNDHWDNRRDRKYDNNKRNDHDWHGDHKRSNNNSNNRKY